MYGQKANVMMATTE